MNAFKSLSKDKKNQLVLLVLGLAVVVGFWYSLIYQSQTRHFTQTRAARDAARLKLDKVRHALAMKDQIESDLADARKRLAGVEKTMASGDLYSWAINTLRQFKADYKVDIPQYSQIDGPKPVDLLADFPYKEAVLTIGGTAEYFQLGKFIADFENQFPYIRVLDLNLEPASAAGGGREQLAFRMAVAALVKPGAS